jgi:L-lactate dehydrogenase complex protein LldG
MRIEEGRERMLGRIREAVAGRSSIDHPGILPAAGMPTDPLIQCFSDRFEEAGGNVIRVADEKEAATWLEAFSTDFGGMAASPRLPDEFRPDLPVLPPEEAPLGISMAVGGVAETGTLLLDSREGRRLQILPPSHLIWVRADSLEPTLAEAFERIAGDLPAAMGLHSGPSKSADIGMVTVQGVHGPGRVIAAIVG